LLGSLRVILQSNGTLCYDADFMPFGGERAYTNTCGQNYKVDAREYSWRFARWLSADWSAVPAPVPYANLTNPQTLNLYAMVGDDPESFLTIASTKARADLTGIATSSTSTGAGAGLPICSVVVGNIVHTDPNNKGQAQKPKAKAKAKTKPGIVVTVKVTHTNVPEPPPQKEGILAP
jgi:hypothetical protein